MTEESSFLRFLIKNQEALKLCDDLDICVVRLCGATVLLRTFLYSLSSKAIGSGAMFQTFKSMRLVSAVVRRQLMPSTAGLISSSAARFSTEISNVSSMNDIPLTIENMDENEEDDDENVNDQLDEFGRAYGTGRRKTSVARVWVKPGTGICTVNGKSFLDYFQLDQRTYALSPFLESNTSCLFDVMCTVKSGGISGSHQLRILFQMKRANEFLSYLRSSRCCSSWYQSCANKAPA